MHHQNFSPQTGCHEELSDNFVHTAGASMQLCLANRKIQYFFGKITGGLGVKSTELGKCAAA